MRNTCVSIFTIRHVGQLVNAEVSRGDCPEHIVQSCTQLHVANHLAMLPARNPLGWCWATWARNPDSSGPRCCRRCAKQRVPPGVHTTAREPKVLAFKNTPKIPREDTQRDTKSAKWWREKEKNAQFLAPPFTALPFATRTSMFFFFFFHFVVLCFLKTKATRLEHQLWPQLVWPKSHDVVSRNTTKASWHLVVPPLPHRGCGGSHHHHTPQL